MAINLHDKPKPPQGRGHNGGKRKRKAAIAALKGTPGGWKKAVRVIDAEHRAEIRMSAAERVRLAR